MRKLRLLAVLAGLGVLASCGNEGPGGGESAGNARTGKPARTPETIAAGREVYRAQCEKCHGAEGKGDGPSRGVALPQPRDFSKKQFKYVSTESRVPSEDDLYRRVTLGIAGTQMAAFGDTVGEWDRWAVVYYVQQLAGIEPAPKAYPIPPRPAYGDAEKRQAGRLYLTHCVKCHGAQGKGDGIAADTLKDAAGNPIRPRNLVAEPLASGEDAEETFCRIRLGMAGTPMEPPESYPVLQDKDAWALAEYVFGLRGKK
jgi:mono/diheme cytochrome c family protein